MSTKYLSSFIDHFQGSLYQNGIPDRFTPQSPARDVQAEELKQILLDAKEGLEVKNTTHEFYETLERITNELRGMTEHSTAFLSRVRKSDAPDYFNIIKNPMDLGTVLKKVKAQQYKDKSQFKADLDLIWDNCLLYNTLPNHPLRRSAMTLRSRANHLLEFVTDPVASTPAPQVIHSQSASRFDRPGSRLDALDASHIVISTANLLGEPKGAPQHDGHRESPIPNDSRDNSLYIKDEEKEGSSTYNDDFQDIEEDEEDESIKTRKGLTSHKMQPGGGRNLDLLKGLAAQSPAPDTVPLGDDALSIYPSGLDQQNTVNARSPTDRSSATPGPVSAAPAGIPELPGTHPGQGSALVAKRAAGMAQGRDRRFRTRTPSVPPGPAQVPLAERTAFRRTPDMMSKFAELERAAQGAQADVDENFKRMLFDPSQQTGVNTLISSTLVEDLSKSFGESSGSIIPSRLVPRTTPSVDHADQDVEWWQTACSDALLANGMPDVPTLPCKRAKVARRLPSAPNSGSQSPSNPFWNDLAHLKRIKRTHHKLAVLRREAPGMYADPDLAESSSDDDEASLSQEEDLALNAKRKALRDIGTRNPESATSRFGQAALQIVCSAILEHAGFDSVQRSALDNISSLLAQFLLSLGSASAFHRDRNAGRASSGTIIKSALRDVAAGDSFPSVRNPLVALARYKEHEMPEHSQELASLKNRLDTAYEQEIEEAQRHEPRLKLEKDVQDLVSFAGEDDDMPGDPAEYKSSYTLLRMLLEAECDHLGLEEVAKLSESGFPLHLTHASLLRQIFPESSGDLPKPFDPPPPYVSLVPVANNQTRSNAIKASIGLLQPFLQARSESAYDLYDDDHLPLPVDSEVRKSLATRPDVPYTTGRVVLSKRKRDAAVPAPSLPASTGLNLTTGQPMPTGGVSRPLQVAEKAKKIRAAV